jgi:hypothetical protein
MSTPPPAADGTHTKGREMGEAASSPGRCNTVRTPRVTAASAASAAGPARASPACGPRRNTAGKPRGMSAGETRDSDREPTATRGHASMKPTAPPRCVLVNPIQGGSTGAMGSARSRTARSRSRLPAYSASVSRDSDEGFDGAAAMPAFVILYRALGRCAESEGIEGVGLRQHLDDAGSETRQPWALVQVSLVLVRSSKHTWLGIQRRKRRVEPARLDRGNTVYPWVGPY